MIKGLYTAAAGMLSASVGMDTLANNLANVNSAGFKKNGVNYKSFPQMLIQKVDAQGAQAIGSVTSGAQPYSTAINFNQGAIYHSGNPLDLAIQGDGFFAVQDGQGQTFYTRNGHFATNAEGDLITLDGLKVLGEDDRPIRLPMDGQEVRINENGAVTSGAQVLGTLKITRFENNAALEKQGDTLFRTTPGATVHVAKTADEPLGYQVFQGSVETANVNVIGELVNNITGMRLYESLQKSIQMQNQTLEKAVNEVGRTR